MYDEVDYITKKTPMEKKMKTEMYADRIAKGPYGKKKSKEKADKYARAVMESL
jgi:hypothetical protein